MGLFQMMFGNHSTGNQEIPSVGGLHEAIGRNLKRERRQLADKTENSSSGYR
jgi:hypothetical protein